jgi:hypothetical protein
MAVAEDQIRRVRSTAAAAAEVFAVPLDAMTATAPHRRRPYAAEISTLGVDFLVQVAFTSP